MRTPKLSGMRYGLLALLAALVVLMGAGSPRTAEAQASPCDPPPTAGPAGGAAVGQEVHTNATAVAASDLCIVYAGTGGSLNSLTVAVNPPGCPAPTATVAGDNRVFIDWGTPCVDPGDAVEINFNSDFAPVEPADVVWTLAGLPIDPRVNKIVPMLFCRIEEDNTAAGDNDAGNDDDAGDANDGRFSNAKLLAGLLEKNRIWAQAGMMFVPNPGLVVEVADPDAAPGQTGDVQDPNSDGERQLRNVARACQLKATQEGHDWTEKMMDIVIRAYVPSLWWGWALELPPCSQTLVPPRKASTEDPDRFPGLGRFGEILAHENGHTLCLRHAGHAHPDLMKGTGFPPWGATVLTAADIRNARGEAQKPSGTIDKDHNGDRIPRTRPRSSGVVDDLDDSPNAWLDLWDVMSVKRPDGLLAIELYPAGLLPDDTTDQTYVVMADLDNNLGTGGSQPFGVGTFEGADLLVEIKVDTVAGQPSVSRTVKRFDGIAFVPFDDPRMQAKVVTMLGASVGDVEEPTSDSVHFRIPEALLPEPLAEGYRVAVYAHDGAGGSQDEAPIIVGSITPLPLPPLMTLNPPISATGSFVTVTGQDFTPNSGVDIFLGADADPIATALADGTGAFQTQFLVPPPSDFVTNTYGNLVSPVLAVDDTYASDGMILTIGVDADGDSNPDTTGGITNLPDTEDLQGAVAEPSGSSFPYTAVAGVAAMILIAGAGGWYVRRRDTR